MGLVRRESCGLRATASSRGAGIQSPCSEWVVWGRVGGPHYPLLKSPQCFKNVLRRRQVSGESEKLDVRNGSHFLEFGSHLVSRAQEPFHAPGSGKLRPSGSPPIMACYSFIQPAVTGCLLCAGHQDRAVNKDLP